MWRRSEGAGWSQGREQPCDDEHKVVLVRKCSGTGEGLRLSAALRHGKRQHTGAPTEADRGRSKHLPAIGSDLNDKPTLIGKIKIEATGMLSETDIDRPFGSIKLRACFEQIER